MAKEEKPKKFTTELVTKINELVGKKYKTDFGVLNKGNLEMALSKENAFDIASEIVQLHPFLDGNKRTAFLVLKARCYKDVDENMINILIEQHDDWLKILSKL